MRRSSSIFWQVFLTTVATVLGVVLLVGYVTRTALASAFDAYLLTLPSTRMGMGGRGMGRAMLGAAEQSFLTAVDRSVLSAAFVAIGIAVLVAFLFARHLSAPIRRLEHAALALADGDLSSRTEPGGPHEIAALGEAFNHMANRLEEGEELRRRMVADVSHELRNPIAAARAQAEGMAEGVLPATDQRLGSLVEDMEHLTRLVDDLQELAVAEAGQIDYNSTPVDLAELARRETARIEAMAGPDVSVSFASATDSAAEPEARVSGDEQRLSQVLRNLLTNALRHTPQGSITVSVSADDHNVVTRVIDTGEGIPAADLPHVFERFYRADAARAAHTGGAGLGLAISARVVRDHGGDVFAQATPGGGATVGFTLPRLLDAEPTR